MKNIMFLLIVSLFIFTSCASQTRYIAIQEPDRVYEFKKVKYSVDKGDVLEITMEKFCPDGMRTCYEVKNLSTGQYGYVLKDRMEKRHRIYRKNDSTKEKKN